jgi:hypothetical protein
LQIQEKHGQGRSAKGSGRWPQHQLLADRKINCLLSFFSRRKSSLPAAWFFGEGRLVRKNKVINVLKMLIYNMTQKRRIIMRKRVGAKK